MTDSSFSKSKRAAYPRETLDRLLAAGEISEEARNELMLEVDTSEVASGDPIAYRNCGGNEMFQQEPHDENRVIIYMPPCHGRTLAAEEFRRQMSPASATRSPGDGPMSTANLAPINPKLIDGGKR